MWLSHANHWESERGWKVVDLRFVVWRDADLKTGVRWKFRVLFLIECNTVLR